MRDYISASLRLFRSTQRIFLSIDATLHFDVAAYVILYKDQKLPSHSLGVISAGTYTVGL